MVAALDGLNVVEWGHGRMAAYAGKLLRDFGANVTLLLDGQSHRDHVLYGALPECQAAGMRAFLDAGKSPETIDPRAADGRSSFLHLVSEADVLLIEQDIRRLESLHLSPEEIAAACPNMVVVSLTLGGLTLAGRYLRHADIVAVAMGGLAARTPPLALRTEADPPLKLGGYQADYTTGLAGACAALAGLQKRRRTSAGSLQDVSAQAVIASFLRWEVAFELYNHRPPPLRGKPSTFAGLVPCKDGFFAFQTSEQYQWDGLKRMMGDPDWSSDERFRLITDGVANWDSFEPGLIAWAMEHTKEEIFRLGQSLRVPMFPLNNIAELLKDPQQKARGFFRTIEVTSASKPIEVPGAVVHLDQTPAFADSRPAPSPGPRPGQGASGEPGSLPLQGLRVADFSWVIAGPYCTQHLVRLGAEVIRIESADHTDISRRLPPYADAEPGPERSGHYHGYNVGKKSITLNLRHPEAQALALEVVKRSDVVIENFSFGMMEKFNLGYERLKEANPNIIYVSSSGLGRSGPYRQYVTWGPPLIAYSGLASVTGKAGSHGERDVGGVWADHLAGLTSAFGLLAALEARDRHGLGQMVEYSMSEAVSAQIPEAFVEYGCTGVPPGPLGNGDRTMAPHGIYPAADEGWVAIAVQDDDDWRKLRDIVGGSDWWLAEDLESLAARKQHEDRIDEHLRAWAKTHDARWISETLQSAGIAAGPALTLAELAEDSLLHGRGFYTGHNHPEVGARVLPGIGWRDASASPELQYAPLLGQHNWEIFVDWLGIDPERFAALVDERAIL